MSKTCQSSEGRAFPDPVGDFLVAGNISWEIDIWKRLRNSQRAAALQYLGTQEGRNFIVTRMVSEVAENYYDLLSLDSRLEILQKTIEIQMASLKVAEGKKKAGRGTELAVQRFIAEVQKNRSEQALIQQEIVETENRINFLAGRYPQPVERISTNFIELNLGVLSAGVPSELLLNRADIREAERNVQAAGLNLEVARARFYPNLSIRSGVGWNAFRSRLPVPHSRVFDLQPRSRYGWPAYQQARHSSRLPNRQCGAVANHLQLPANGAGGPHRSGQPLDESRKLPTQHRPKKETAQRFRKIG